MSVESNLFNSTGSEPVHAFIFLSPIATALYFTRFFVRTSKSAPGIPPAGHPIYCLPAAMNGSHHAHHFQQKLCSADPLDLSQFVVDLRSCHLAYWRQFSGYDPRDTKSKKFTYHHWCAFPTKPAHVTYSPYFLPKYFYLDLPKHIVRSVARIRLRVHTLKVEQAT
eukprot:1162092-Pelagomonas_calceolata.AAC.1